MIKSYKKVLLALASIGALIASPALSLAASAAPAPAPCSPGVDGKFDCIFWTTTPVEGPSNGTLAAGKNWVTCQQQGATVRVSGWENNWWAWTLRDSGTGTYGSGWGWVNAVYVKGGANYGVFQGVPPCNGSHGLPPQAAKPAPAPAPSANTAPAATPVNKPAASKANRPANLGVTTPAAAGQTYAANAPGDTAPDSNAPYTASCPPRHTCYHPTGQEFITAGEEGFSCGLDRTFTVWNRNKQKTVCRDDLQAARKLIQNDRY